MCSITVTRTAEYSAIIINETVDVTIKEELDLSVCFQSVVSESKIKTYRIF
jgi:hypothetical protein